MMDCISQQLLFFQLSYKPLNSVRLYLKWIFIFYLNKVLENVKSHCFQWPIVIVFWHKCVELCSPFFESHSNDLNICHEMNLVPFLFTANSKCMGWEQALCNDSYRKKPLFKATKMSVELIITPWVNKFLLQNWQESINSTALHPIVNVFRL